MVLSEIKCPILLFHPEEIGASYRSLAPTNLVCGDGGSERPDLFNSSRQVAIAAPEGPARNEHGKLWLDFIGQCK
jgi:hypothetical protein